MLQKLIEQNCIKTNLSFNNFKNGFCQNKSDLKLKSKKKLWKIMENYGIMVKKANLDSWHRHLVFDVKTAYKISFDE